MYPKLTQFTYINFRSKRHVPDWLEVQAKISDQDVVKSIGSVLAMPFVLEPLKATSYLSQWMYPYFMGWHDQ